MNLVNSNKQPVGINAADRKGQRIIQMLARRADQLDDSRKAITESFDRRENLECMLILKVSTELPLTSWILALLMLCNSCTGLSPHVMKNQPLSLSDAHVCLWADADR